MAHRSFGMGPAMAGRPAANGDPNCSVERTCHRTCCNRTATRLQCRWRMKLTNPLLRVPQGKLLPAWAWLRLLATHEQQAPSCWGEPRARPIRVLGRPKDRAQGRGGSQKTASRRRMPSSARNCSQKRSRSRRSERRPPRFAWRAFLVSNTTDVSGCFQTCTSWPKRATHNSHTSSWGQLNQLLPTGPRNLIAKRFRCPSHAFCVHPRA